MGEIRAGMALENYDDRVAFKRGYGAEADIRRATLEGIVDTGAVMLVLPGDAVERLGLDTQRTVTVTYADERREKRPVAGPLTVGIGNRFMIADCVVGPPGGEALIGYVVLNRLDLIPDPANRTLSPRPESPDRPMLRM